MIRYILDDDHIELQGSGSLAQCISDLGFLIGLQYNQLCDRDPDVGEIFRLGIISLFGAASPVWERNPAPDPVDGLKMTLIRRKPGEGEKP